MDRRRRVLRRGPSPVVQQPFQTIGVNNGLLGLCVSCGGVGGRVVGLRGEKRFISEAVAERGNLTNIELTSNDVSALFTR